VRASQAGTVTGLLNICHTRRSRPRLYGQVRAAAAQLFMLRTGKASASKYQSQLQGYDTPYFEENVTIALQSLRINRTVHLRFLPISCLQIMSHTTLLAITLYDNTQEATLNNLVHVS